MASVLFIEWCNYVDYPTGGHLSFALHMLGAFGNQLKLVGIDTEREHPIGTWSKKRVNNIDYDYFCVGRVEKKDKKPLIPNRITAYLQIRKYVSKILKTGYDYIVVQTPEVLLSIPNKYLDRVTLIMPGVENPMEFSRYKFVRRIANLYNLFYFKKVSRVSVILPAADNVAIGELLDRNKGAIDPLKVKQFPTRYDATIFRAKQDSDIRTRYGIDKDVLLYVTVGRLNWIKGWKFMIDSFCCLNNPKAKLFFIGDGEDEAQIKEYLQHCTMKDKIQLLGKKTLDEISDYLNMADAFIMGSYKEGWSTSLVEAVACACPCVVTDFSSASDMVVDGVNGWVVKNRSEEEFAQRMKDVIMLDKTDLLEKAQEVSMLSVQNMREQLILKSGWTL